jgi:methylation protein EvaC
MRRSACTACGGHLESFLNLGDSPLADKFPKDSTATERWYPLEVAVCRACWLVQLLEVVDDAELYGSDYAFSTGASPAAVDYFAELAAKLLFGFGNVAKRLTVEIACNDGTLLRHFADAGCNAIGIEPSGVRPREAGIGVIPRPFTAELARTRKGTAGLVIACNVIAHVADPRDFLNGVQTLLADDGVAVIEFQDVAALIAGCQYDHVYHEHRQFFSLASFSRMLKGSGLEIFDWERTPAQGGSIRVYLRLGRAGATTIVTEPWLEKTAPYEGMQARAEYARQRLVSLVGSERNDGRIVVGWGASAKSATLFNYCGLSRHDIMYVEDLTPGKIGRVTPGSHIPVRAPSAVKPGAYLLTSWNYAGAVIRREHSFLASGGRIIIPGAVPVVL